MFGAVDKLENDVDEVSKMKTSSEEIEVPFDLEEDLGKPLEKYQMDFDLSEDDDAHDHSSDDEDEELYKSTTDVPHSMPMDIPFAQKARSLHGKEPQSVQDALSNDSIYENMQVLFRSIRSSDRRVLGTKPEDCASAYRQYYPYSQTSPHHLSTQYEREFKHITFDDSSV